MNGRALAELRWKDRRIDWPRIAAIASTSRTWDEVVERARAVGVRLPKFPRRAGRVRLGCFVCAGPSVTTGYLQEPNHVTPHRLCADHLHLDVRWTPDRIAKEIATYTETPKGNPYTSPEFVARFMDGFP